MKILIEESVLRQALDALEKVAELTGARWALENNYAGHLEAITALRTALDAAEKVEPVMYRYRVPMADGRSAWTTRLPQAEVILETQPLFDHPAPAVPEGGWCDCDSEGGHECGLQPNCRVQKRWLSAAPTPPTDTGALAKLGAGWTEPEGHNALAQADAACGRSRLSDGLCPGD